MSTSTVPFALGEMRRDARGELEGWCRYPDRPGARATVELLCNGVVVRAMRATRLCPDLRDLGIGDGFHGFSFPLPDARPDGPRTVLEVREQRLGTTIGRLVLGGRSVMEGRLDAAASAVGSLAAALDGLAPDPGLAAVMGALGHTLLHLSGRPAARRVPGQPGLQACLQQVADIPVADLGWCAGPRLGVVVPAIGDLADLAARLRGTARVLRGLGAEILLLEDGTMPSAVLLPTRLRGLVLVRTDRSAGWGSALNAATAAARSDILAFARPGGPGLAGLLQAVHLAPGTIGLEAPLVPGAAGPGPTRHHRLHCVVARADLAAMGGFDPVADDDELREDLLAKARALGLAVTTWGAPLPGRLPQAAPR